MRVFASIVVGFSLLVVVSFVPVRAQAPVVPPAAAKVAEAPKYDEDDLTMLSGLRTLQALANRDCQGLDSMKAFQQQAAAVQARIEVRHANLTIDWSAADWKLIVKPAASK